MCFDTIELEHLYLYGKVRLYIPIGIILFLQQNIDRAHHRFSSQERLE